MGRAKKPDRLETANTALPRSVKEELKRIARSYSAEDAEKSLGVTLPNGLTPANLIRLAFERGWDSVVMDLERGCAARKSA